MINLQQIFNDLTYGEFSQIAIGGGAAGEIAENDYPRVVSFVNMALTALHRRFLLRKGSLSLQQDVDTTVYYLRDTYAVTNATSVVPHKYILDTAAKPFNNNLFKVEQIFGLEGVQYELNDTTIAVPILNPRFDVLEMTVEIPEILLITYRENHPKILMTGTFNPSLVQVDIPEFVYEALLNHIAARLFAPISGGEGAVSLNAVFNSRYELECVKIKEEGLSLDNYYECNAFDFGGWV